MTRFLKLVLAVAALTAGIAVSSEAARRRGGAANIMNSPGYQRRLQEIAAAIAATRRADVRTST